VTFMGADYLNLALSVLINIRAVAITSRGYCFSEVDGSHFQTPAPILLKNFWNRIRHRNFSNLRMKILFKLWKPSM